MNRGDVIRMAREAGICIANSILLPAPDGQVEALERFATLVAAAEREACAKACEQLVGSYAESVGSASLVSIACATAIRARGQEPPR